MIGAAEIAQEALINKQAGCFEVGLCIGSWAEGDYGANAQTYIDMVNAMAANGVVCRKFDYWYEETGEFSVPSLFTELMQTYEPDMTPITQRASGVTPTPTPTPPVLIADGTAPAPVFLNGTLYSFACGVDNRLYCQEGAGKWQALGGQLTAAPAVASDGNDIHIVVRGANQQTLYYRTLLNNPAWVNIGGTARSAPSLAFTPTVAPTHPVLVVEVRGNDKAVYQKNLDMATGTWAKWVSLGGQLA
jgi:hypothetical protein